MTLTSSVFFILLTLAIIGTISIGVWGYAAVLWFTAKPTQSPEEVRTEMLRTRLVTLTEENKELRDQVSVARTQLDELNNHILTRLLQAKP